ncbi:MAG: methyltransferase domain-containing protein [Chloroflexi bacterium]|nr:methyltransferase domain-containing protein [Chloroflexota bacterium]
MQPSLLEYLACPDDGHDALVLERAEIVAETGDVRSGQLLCRQCNRRYPIVDGIPSMLPGPLASLAGEEVPVGSSGVGDQANEMHARDRLAEEYARELGVDNQRNRVEVAATLECLGAALPDVILDAGSGSGRFVRRLAGRCRAIVALDFSLASLRLLVGGLSPMERRQVYAVQGDVLHLPFRAGAFDKCLSFAVLEHIPSRAGKHGQVRELNRVLKPNGKLVIATYNHSLYWRRKGIRTGYHAGRIYFENLMRDEFAELLQPQFAVERISGINNRLPKGLNERLGEVGYWLDRALEGSPVSDLFANYLLACCVKMTRLPLMKGSRD